MCKYIELKGESLINLLFVMVKVPSLPVEPTGTSLKPQLFKTDSQDVGLVVSCLVRLEEE